MGSKTNILDGLFRRPSALTNHGGAIRGCFRTAGIGSTLAAHFAAFAPDLSVKLSAPLALDGFAAFFADALIERCSVAAFYGFAAFASSFPSKIRVCGKAAFFIVIMRAAVGIRNFACAFRSCGWSWFRHYLFPPENAIGLRCVHPSQCSPALISTGRIRCRQMSCWHCRRPELPQSTAVFSLERLVFRRQQRWKLFLSGRPPAICLCLQRLAHCF